MVESVPSLQVDFNSDNLETNCQCCFRLNSELQKAKDEILPSKEITKELQQELRIAVRPEPNRDLRIVLYLLYSGTSSHRREMSSQTMDIECVKQQTDAPTSVGISQKHKVHVTLYTNQVSMQKFIQCTIKCIKYGYNQ
jgi:hypothetical protein